MSPCVTLFFCLFTCFNCHTHFFILFLFIFVQSLTLFTLCSACLFCINLHRTSAGFYMRDLHWAFILVHGCVCVTLQLQHQKAVWWWGFCGSVWTTNWLKQSGSVEAGANVDVRCWAAVTVTGISAMQKREKTLEDMVCTSTEPMDASKLTSHSCCSCTCTIRHQLTCWPPDTIP